jgi:hypothetical protein
LHHVCFWLAVMTNTFLRPPVKKKMMLQSVPIQRLLTPWIAPGFITTLELLVFCFDAADLFEHRPDTRLSQSSGR